MIKKALSFLQNKKNTIIWGKKVRRAIRNYDVNNMPLFEYIEIETINRCNGTCPFCPVNVNEKQREYHKMTIELFNSIINQLHDMNYTGRLALFSNNEPFLDERMEEMLKVAKKACPNAYLYLFSNATVLSIDRFIEVINYLDELIIDNYSDDDVMTENVLAIKEYIKDKPDLENKVHIWMRKQNEVLTSRGGLAPNKKNVAYIKYPCYLPFKQLVIRPDGKISLCCNDALGKYTIGDATLSSLKDIWYNDKYFKIRCEMKKNGRKNLNLCNHCDSQNT